MRNKLIATIALSAIAMGVSAAAQANAHPYVGLSAGYFNAGSNDFDGKDEESTAGLQLGYHFNQDWSIEANHNEGTGTSDPHTRVAGLTGAYRLLGEETQLLGLAAMQNINNPEGDNDVDFALGAAVSHYFTDNVEGRFSVLAGVSDEYYASNLSLNYHFGRHAEKDVVEPEPEKVAPAVVMTKTLHAHFSTDKSIVREADKVEIISVSDSMKQNPGSTATIVGHTDSTASDEYNQALSERRAEAVKAVMVDQGVNADAIETSGQGESQPVGDNDTAEGRQENRRIEAVVTGLPE
jgi:OOP family OmpA-OmpF porin